MNNPIIFFDSGIGGSTILKEVIKKFPNENYIYYADTINNPYGEKTTEELFQIVDTNIAKLIKFRPKLFVCACNTATETVLSKIRTKYPEYMFIGTEPAVKLAHEYYPDKTTLVMTTKATANSEKFKLLFDTYKTKDMVLVEAHELAGLIENNQPVDKYLSKILKKYQEKHIELVVLGCTHFPIVKENIKKILHNTIFIDGAKGISKQIGRILKDNFNTGPGSIAIIETKGGTRERILEIIKP